MLGTEFNSHILKRKGLLKIVAFITLWAFLFTNIGGEYILERAWASGTPIQSSGTDFNRTDGSGFTEELNIETFTLPYHLGSIENKYNTNSDKAIIHIQDAHCNYGAQHKINDIIGYVNEKYGINTVNLEGGNGSYDLSPFTKIAEENIREKVSDYFVKEGIVNGAEYFAINNPGKVKLWGIEDIELYVANLASYRNFLKHKESADALLKSLNHILNTLKLRIYSKELLEVDRKSKQYSNEKVGFKEYLAYLIKKAEEKHLDIDTFPNIHQLHEVLKKESEIDFNKANAQRNKLIERLQKKLSHKELEELLLKSAEFKEEKLSQKDFYTYLHEKAKLINFDLDEFPEFKKYTLYISIYSAIDKSAIFSDINKLEGQIIKALCTNATEKELVTLSKNLVLLNNMFNLSLTKDDYAYYRKNEKSFIINNFTSFITKEAPLHKTNVNLSGNEFELDALRKSISKFYEYSFERDQAFLKNIKFARGGRKTSILITGGFHAENLHKLFEENEISYISIMPNFKNNDNYECPYFRLLAGKQSPLEEKIDCIINSTLTYYGVLDNLWKIIATNGERVRFNTHLEWAEASARNKALVFKDRRNQGLSADGNILSEKYVSRLDSEDYVVTRVGKHAKSPVFAQGSAPIQKVKDTIKIARYYSFKKWCKGIKTAIQNHQFNKLFTLITHEPFRAISRGNLFAYTMQAFLIAIASPLLLQYLGAHTSGVLAVSGIALGMVINNGSERDKVDLLIERLEAKHWDWRRRIDAANALGQIGGKRAIASLCKSLLEDENSEVRSVVAMVLGKFKDSISIEALGKALKNKKEGLNPRIAAAYALGEIGEPAIEFLIAPLENGDWGVCNIIDKALSKINHPKARSYSELCKGKIREILGDTLNPDFSDTTLRLIQMGKDSEEGFNEVIEILHRGYVKEAALFALGRIGSPEAIPHILKAWDTSHIGAKALAEIGLDNLKDNTQGLIKIYAHSKEEEIRTKAQKLLETQELNAIPALIEAHNEVFLRSSASELLANLGLPAISAIEEALLHGKSKSSYQRKALVETLANIEGGKERTASVLEEVVRDDGDFDVCLAASHALSELGVESLAEITHLRKAYLLLEKLDDPEELIKMGKTALIPACKRFKRPPNPAVREGTLSILVASQDVRAAEAIILAEKVYSYWDDNMALVKMKNVSLPVLIKHLDSEDSFTRRFCANTLGEIGNPSAVEPIAIRLEKEPDEEMRKICMEALEKLGYPWQSWNSRSVREITRSLEDDVTASGSAGAAIFIISPPAENLIQFGSAPAEVTTEETISRRIHHDGLGYKIWEDIEYHTKKIEVPATTNKAFFRGTLEGQPQDSTGFLRLDPPKAMSDIGSLDREGKSKLLRDTVNIVTFLLQPGAINSNKKLVLLDRVTDLFRKVQPDLPQGFTLREFAQMMRGLKLEPVAATTVERGTVEPTEKIKDPLLQELDPNTTSMTLIVSNLLGIHARTADKIVNVTSKYPEIDIYVTKGKNTANADSILNLMFLAAQKGDVIKIVVKGGSKDERGRAIRDLASIIAPEDSSESPQSTISSTAWAALGAGIAALFSMPFTIFGSLPLAIPIGFASTSIILFAHAMASRKTLEELTPEHPRAPGIFKDQTEIAHYSSFKEWRKDVKVAILTRQLNKLFALITHEPFHAMSRSDYFVYPVQTGLLMFLISSCITSLADVSTIGVGLSAFLLAGMYILKSHKSADAIEVTIDEEGIAKSVSDRMLEKRELDNIALNVTAGKNRISDIGLKLFKQLDTVAAQEGFKNLHTQSRYLMVKLLCTGDRRLIEQSASITETAKTEILKRLGAGQDLSFADVAEDIYYGLIVEDGEFEGFTQVEPLPGAPRILSISHSRFSMGRKDSIKRQRKLYPHFYRFISLAEQFGFTVDMYDVALTAAMSQDTDPTGLNHLRQELTKGYDLVYFTPLNPMCREDVNVMRCVAEQSPKSFLCIGGEIATFVARELMEETIPDIDFMAISGYTAKTVLNMAAYFEGNKGPQQFQNLKGIYYRGPPGKVCFTGIVPPYSMKYLRVTSRAIDFNKVNHEAYWNANPGNAPRRIPAVMTEDEKIFWKDTIRIVTRSHCPMGCNFCGFRNILSDATGRKPHPVLSLPPEDVVMLVRKVIKAYPRIMQNGLIFLNDDDFIDVDTGKMIDALEGEFSESNLAFFGYTRCDRLAGLDPAGERIVVNKDLIERLRHAKFRKLFLGVESFSPRILRHIKKYGKRLTEHARELNLQVIRAARQAAIIPIFAIILFYPEVNFADIKMTIEGSIDAIEAGGTPNIYPFAEAREGSDLVKENKLTGRYKIVDKRFVPRDREMAELAMEAQKLSAEIENEIRRNYNWNHEFMPELTSLALFKAIYRIRNIPTDRIDSVIRSVVDRYRDKIVRNTYEAIASGNCGGYTLKEILEELKRIVPDYERRLGELFNSLSMKDFERYNRVRGSIDVAQRKTTLEEFTPYIEAFKKRLIEEGGRFGKFIIAHDNDTDGICSASILKCALEAMGFAVETRAVDILLPRVLDTIYERADAPVIFADLGLDTTERIESANVKKLPTFIINHHGGFKGERQKNTFVLDPVETGIETHDRACSATVSYLLARSIDPAHRNLSGIAVTGVLCYMPDISRSAKPEGLNGIAVADAVAANRAKVTLRPAGYDYAVTLPSGHTDDARSIDREILKPLGGNSFLEGGPALGIEFLMYGLNEDIESAIERANKHKYTVYEKLIKLLRAGMLKQCGSIQWFNAEHILDPMATRSVGDFMEYVINNYTKDPLNPNDRTRFIEPDKYLVGIQKVGALKDLDTQTDVPSSKVSIKFPPEVMARVNRGELPTPKEITKTIFLPRSSVHNYRLSTVIPDSDIREIIQRIEGYITNLEQRRSSMPRFTALPRWFRIAIPALHREFEKNGWNPEGLYRIYLPLALYIMEKKRQNPGKRIVIGVAGPTGVGKSTFSSALSLLFKHILGPYASDRMSMDNFYYSEDRFAELGFPKGYWRWAADVLDTRQYVDEMLNFKRGGITSTPFDDYIGGLRITQEERLPVIAEEILLAEGVHLLLKDDVAGYNDVYDAIDLKVFLDADTELIGKWRMSRDKIIGVRSEEYIVRRWEEFLKPMTEKDREKKSNADLIILLGEGHIIEGISGALQDELMQYREKVGNFLSMYLVEEIAIIEKIISEIKEPEILTGLEAEEGIFTASLKNYLNRHIAEFGKSLLSDRPDYNKALDSVFYIERILGAFSSKSQRRVFRDTSQPGREINLVSEVKRIIPGQMHEDYADFVLDELLDFSYDLANKIKVHTGLVKSIIKKYAGIQDIEIIRRAEKDAGKPVEKLGVFASSFNPMHTGHERMMEEATDMLSLDENLCILSDYKGDSDVPFEKKAEMLEAFAKGHPSKAYSVAISRSEVFLDMLAGVKEIYGEDTKINLIMGYDRAISLFGEKGFYSKRENIARLFRMCNVVIFLRSDLDEGENIFDRLPVLSEFKKQITILPPLDRSIRKLSSSLVKEKLAQGGSLLGLVPEAVAGIIEHDRLYVSFMDKVNTQFRIFVKKIIDRDVGKRVSKKDIADFVRLLKELPQDEQQRLLEGFTDSIDDVIWSRIKAKRKYATQIREKTETPGNNLVVASGVSLDLTLVCSVINNSVLLTGLSIDAGETGTNIARALDNIGRRNILVIPRNKYSTGGYFDEILRDRQDAVTVDTKSIFTPITLILSFPSEERESYVYPRDAKLSDRESETFKRAAGRGIKNIENPHAIFFHANVPSKKDPGLLLSLMKQARERNCWIAYDSKPSVWKDSEFAASLLDSGYVDVLKLNLHEFCVIEEKGNELAKASDEERAQVLRNFAKKHKLSIVLLSIGDRGLLVFVGDTVYKAVSPPVKYFNSTGAGDALLANFVAFLPDKSERQLNIDEIIVAIKKAVAAGAATVTKPGVSLASLSEIENITENIEVKKLALSSEKNTPESKYTVSNLEIGGHIISDPYGRGEINLERLVSGANLVGAYNKLLENRGEKTTLPVGNSENIINRAIEASRKGANERDREDNACLEVALNSIENLAKAIVEVAKKRKGGYVRVVLFGGVAEGGGEFYRRILQTKVDELFGEEKKMEIIPSTMGDKRAIIGAVGYAKFVLYTPATDKKYAVGIDLGGTNVRAALVNLETMHIEREIVKSLMFPENKMLDDIPAKAQMELISKKLQDNSLGMDFNNLPDGLENFLLEPEDRKKHHALTEILLNQLESLIGSFELEEVGFMSIASPGLFSEKGPVKLAYNLPITCVDVRDKLNARLGLPVYMGNDVASAGVGEIISGAGKGLNAIFSLNVGTGLNMCLVEKVAEVSSKEGKHPAQSTVSGTAWAAFGAGLIALASIPFTIFGIIPAAVPFGFVFTSIILFVHAAASRKPLDELTLEQPRAPGIFKDQAEIAHYSSFREWRKDVKVAILNRQFNKLFTLITHEPFHCISRSNLFVYPMQVALIAGLFALLLYHPGGLLIFSLLPVAMSIEEGGRGKGEEARIRFLITKLKNRNYHTREAAAFDLRKIDDPRARLYSSLYFKKTDWIMKEGIAQLELLIEALKSGPEVHSSAAEVLRKICDRTTIESLVRALKREDVYASYETRRVIYELLYKIGVEACQSLMKAFNETSNPKARFNIVCALRSFGSAPAPLVPSLIKVLDETENIGLLTQIPFLLAGIGPAAEPAIPALANALTRTSHKDARWAIAFNLSKFGSAAEPAVPALGKALDEARDDHERDNIISALYHLGPVAEQALPALTNAFNKIENLHKQLVVIELLGKIGSTAVPTLLTILKRSVGCKLTEKKDVPLASAAARALGKIANSLSRENPIVTDEITPALISALDNVSIVHEAAAKALGKICDFEKIKHLYDVVARRFSKYLELESKEKPESEFLSGLALLVENTAEGQGYEVDFNVKSMTRAVKYATLKFSLDNIRFVVMYNFQTTEMKLISEEDFLALTNELVEPEHVEERAFPGQWTETQQLDTAKIIDRFAQAYSERLGVDVYPTVSFVSKDERERFYVSSSFTETGKTEISFRINMRKWTYQEFRQAANSVLPYMFADALAVPGVDPGRGKYEIAEFEITPQNIRISRNMAFETNGFFDTQEIYYQHQKLINDAVSTCLANVYVDRTVTVSAQEKERSEFLLKTEADIERFSYFYNSWVDNIRNIPVQEEPNEPAKMLVALARYEATSLEAYYLSQREHEKLEMLSKDFHKLTKELISISDLSPEKQDAIRKAYAQLVLSFRYAIMTTRLGFPCKSRIPFDSGSDFKEIALFAAREVASLLLAKPNAVVGLATGSTMPPVYEALATYVNDFDINLSVHPTFFNLDEYYYTEIDNPRIYANYMEQNFYGRITNSEHRPKLVRAVSENGRIKVTASGNAYLPEAPVSAEGLEAYCRWYDEEVRKKGGIDLQLLGIGRGEYQKDESGDFFLRDKQGRKVFLHQGGHIGFNEPLEIRFELPKGKYGEILRKALLIVAKAQPRFRREIEFGGILPERYDQDVFHPLLTESISEDTINESHIMNAFKELGMEYGISAENVKIMVLFFANQTRRVELSDTTILANKEDFAGKAEARYAVSMGLGSILRAKKIILLAQGDEKRDVVTCAANGNITPFIPATILQIHPNVRFMLDDLAAENLLENPHRFTHEEWIVHILVELSLEKRKPLKDLSIEEIKEKQRLNKHLEALAWTPMEAKTHALQQLEQKIVRTLPKDTLIIGTQPHPDDVAICIGGLVPLLAGKGNEDSMHNDIHLLTATNGYTAVWDCDQWIEYRGMKVRGDLISQLLGRLWEFEKERELKPFTVPDEVKGEFRENAKVLTDPEIAPLRNERVDKDKSGNIKPIQFTFKNLERKRGTEISEDEQKILEITIDKLNQSMRENPPTYEELVRLRYHYWHVHKKPIRIEEDKAAAAVLGISRNKVTNLELPFYHTMREGVKDQATPKDLALIKDILKRIFVDGGYMFKDEEARRGTLKTKIRGSDSNNLTDEEVDIAIDVLDLIYDGRDNESIMAELRRQEKVVHASRFEAILDNIKKAKGLLEPVLFLISDDKDPMGTHGNVQRSLRRCMDELLREYKLLKPIAFVHYHGAWGEYPIAYDLAKVINFDGAINNLKQESIKAHTSQDPPRFPGDDPRPFYQRAYDRNTSAASVLKTSLTDNLVQHDFAEVIKTMIVTPNEQHYLKPPPSNLDGLVYSVTPDRNDEDPGTSFPRDDRGPTPENHPSHLPTPTERSPKEKEDNDSKNVAAVAEEIGAKGEETPATRRETTLDTLGQDKNRSLIVRAIVVVDEDTIDFTELDDVESALRDLNRAWARSKNYNGGNFGEQEHVRFCIKGKTEYETIANIEKKVRKADAEGVQIVVFAPEERDENETPIEGGQLVRTALKAHPLSRMKNLSIVPDAYADTSPVDPAYRGALARHFGHLRSLELREDKNEPDIIQMRKDCIRRITASLRRVSNDPGLYRVPSSTDTLEKLFKILHTLRIKSVFETIDMLVKSYEALAVAL